MQRSLLTQYHVTDPGDFYNGSDFWKVPNDPTVAATKHPQRRRLRGGGRHRPCRRRTCRSHRPATDRAQWALSSPMVTLNYREPRRLPDRERPARARLREVHAAATSPPASRSSRRRRSRTTSSPTTPIAKALTLQRGGNSKVVLGNLLTIPLDNKVLYVEPVYTQARGAELVPDPAPRDRGVRRRPAGVQAHPERRPPRRPSPTTPPAADLAAGTATVADILVNRCG